MLFEFQDLNTKPLFCRTMNSNQLHLPFSINDDNTGLTEVDGMLHPEESDLKLEFQMKDGVLGIVKGKAKSIRIDYKEVGDATFKSSFWGTSLTLHLNSLEILSKIPFTQGNRIKLRIKRRDREMGQAVQVFIEEKLGIQDKELPGGQSPRPFYE